LFAEALSKNSTLESINLESNFLTGEGIMVRKLLYCFHRCAEVFKHLWTWVGETVTFLPEKIMCDC